MPNESETVPAFAEETEHSHLERAVSAGVHILSSLVVIALSRDSWCDAAQTALRTSKVG